jgi:hypothetical protein
MNSAPGAYVLHGGLDSIFESKNSITYTFFLLKQSGYHNSYTGEFYLPLIIQSGVLVHPARLDPLDEQARRLLPSVLLVQESRLQKEESITN